MRHVVALFALYFAGRAVAFLPEAWQMIVTGAVVVPIAAYALYIERKGTR